MVMRKMRTVIGSQAKRGNVSVVRRKKRLLSICWRGAVEKGKVFGIGSDY